MPSHSTGDELSDEVLAAHVQYRLNDVGATLAGWTAVAPVLDESRMLPDSCVETEAVSIDNSAANLLISVVGRGAAECRLTWGRAERRLRSEPWLPRHGHVAIV